ncbi:uncharacterized protein KZ484_023540 [Pholidichthys leucotaenia]
MREHPECKWVQFRPKKVSLPYQCEHCRCSFKTLDLLFTHQLCHSSTQDNRKDVDSNDRIALSNNKMLSPLANIDRATLCKGPMGNLSPLTTLLQYSEPVPQETPRVPIVSVRPGLAHSCEHPSRTNLMQNQEVSHNQLDKNTTGKPITPLRTVRHVTQNASMPNEGSSDGVKCAVCGNTFAAISDLYQHYLQHARGQV